MQSQPLQVSYKQREQVWYNHSTRQCLDHDNANKCVVTRANVVVTPLKQVTAPADGKVNASRVVWIMAIEVNEAYELREENGTTARRFIVSPNNPSPISPCKFEMTRQGTATGTLYCQKNASIMTRSIMLSVIKQITPNLQARLYSAEDSSSATTATASRSEPGISPGTSLAVDASTTTNTSTATTTTTTTTATTTTTKTTTSSTGTTSTASTAVEEDANFDPNGKVVLHRTMALGADGNITVTVAYDQDDYKEWRNASGLRPENISYTETTQVDRVSGQTMSSQSQSVMHDRTIMGTNATNASIGFTAQSTVTLTGTLLVDGTAIKHITDQLSAMDGQDFSLSGVNVENATAATTTNNSSCSNNNTIADCNGTNIGTTSTDYSIQPQNEHASQQPQPEPKPIGYGPEQEDALAAVRKEQEGEVTQAFALVGKAKGEAQCDCGGRNSTRHVRCSPPPEPTPPRAAVQKTTNANVLVQQVQAKLISTNVMGKPVALYATLLAGVTEYTELACKILKLHDSGKIKLLDTRPIYNAPDSEKNDGSSPLYNIRDQCGAPPVRPQAPKRSSCNCVSTKRYDCPKTIVPGTRQWISLSVLKAIIKIADDVGFVQINALVGGCHSKNSRHYFGLALDIEINDARIQSPGAGQHGPGQPANRNVNSPAKRTKVENICKAVGMSDKGETTTEMKTVHLVGPPRPRRYPIKQPSHIHCAWHMFDLVPKTAGVSFDVSSVVGTQTSVLYNANKKIDLFAKRNRRVALPSISKTLTIFNACIATPIPILRLCAELSCFVQAGVALTTDKTEIKIEPYLRAGFTFEAKASAWIAEVGVFATGTLANLAMPASLSLKDFSVQDPSKARVCLRWVSKNSHTLLPFNTWLVHFILAAQATKLCETDHTACRVTPNTQRLCQR